MENYGNGVTSALVYVHEYDSCKGCPNDVVRGKNLGQPNNPIACIGRLSTVQFFQGKCILITGLVEGAVRDLSSSQCFDTQPNNPIKVRRVLLDSKRKIIKVLPE